jgi:hypothetical protein
LAFDPRGVQPIVLVDLDVVDDIPDVLRLGLAVEERSEIPLQAGI